MLNIVQANPQDWKGFASFPRALYAGEATFSPVPDHDLRAWFSGSHPCSSFLRFQAFLVQRDHRTVGHCAAFVNTRLPIDGAHLGTIGLYECEEDAEASAALLAAAQDWLLNQGCRTAWGPMNGSIWTGYRCMTSGFGGRTFYGEPVNKPWYAAQFTTAGFEPIRRWHSFFIEPSDTRRLQADQATLAAVAQQGGYRVRTPDPHRVEAELDGIHSIIEDSYSDFLGFNHLEPGEFRDLFGGLTKVWNPELIQIAMDAKGQEVGFNIVLPDPGRGVRAMRGGASPLARLRYLLHREANPAHLDLYLGIHRRAAGLGVGSLLTHDACQNAIEAMVPFVIALVSDGVSFVTVGAQFPAAEHHEYHLYAKSLIR